MALTRITKGVIKPNENYDTHNINSTGIVTAIGLDVNGNGDISGNLSVGGVLTYEDVTSIDSVGIITAQKDIHVGAGVSVVGIVTAATFKGDGDFVELDVDGHTNLDNLSIAGVTTTSDNIIIPDDKKLILGTQTGRQLHLYHNMVGSSNHVIESTSSSNHLILKASVINPRANYFSFRNLAHNQNVFIVDADNSTKLYFNGNEKLTTENTGVNITGIVTATSADINGDLDVDGHTNLDNVSVGGITTTTGNIEITKNHPAIQFNDSSDNPDYNIQNYDGKFLIYDSTNGATRLTVNTDGHIDVHGNLDVLSAATISSNCNVNGALRVNTNRTISTQMHVVGGTGSGTAYDAAVFAGGQNSTSGSGARIWLTGCENDPIARGTVIEGVMTNNSNAHALIFKTSPSSAVPIERLRIKSDGGILQTKTGGNANYTISRNESVGTTDQPIGVIDFASNTAHTTQSRLMGKTRGTSNVGGDLVVETRADGGSLDERIRFTSEGMTIKNAGAGGGIGINALAATSHYGLISSNANRPSENDVILGISGDWNGDSVGGIYVRAGADTTNKDDGTLTFHTQTSGTSTLSERLRIDSGGRILTGGETGTNASAGGIHVKTSNGAATTQALVLVNAANNANTEVQIKMVASAASPNDRYNAINCVNVAGNNRMDTAFVTCPGGTPLERMRLDNEGRLIIGHTASIGRHEVGDAALQVSGTGPQDSGIVAGRWSNNNQPAFLELSKSRATSIGGNTAVQADDILGQVQFSGNDGTRYLGAAFIKGIATSPIADYDVAGYLSFGTNYGTTSPTERLRIRSTGEVSLGYVDSASTSALHIRSVTSAETTLELSTKDNYNGSLPSAKISFTQQNGTEIARIKCDTNTGAANMADLVFWTNYGGLYERMRITKTGQVNIDSGSNANGSLRIGGNYDSTGTSDATAKLGMITMPHFTNAEEPIQIIRGYSDSSQSLIAIGGGTSSANVATNIVFYTSTSITGTGTERVRIASDGDVTITATGDPTLTVTGSGHPQLTLTNTSGSDHCGVNFGDSSDHNAGMIQYTNSTNHMQFHTNGRETMRLDSNGSTIIYRSNSTTSGSYSTLEHMDSNAMREHVRYISAGSSSQTFNLMRVRRHYWGGGFYKIWVKQVYYVATNEAVWWLNGHGRNDGSYSPSWNLGHEDKNGSIGSSFLQITSASNSSPGNDYATYVDVYATVSAYHHYIVHIEAMGPVDYSTNTSSISSNGYALF